MAGWQASHEPALCTDYHGWTVWKPGCWSQGPSLLQSLNLLAGFDLDALDPDGTDFVHLVTEAMKLRFADREACYGDPDFTDIPVARLLSADYAAARHGLVADTASVERRPGRLPGFEPWADAAVERAARPS